MPRRKSKSPPRRKSKSPPRRKSKSSPRRKSPPRRKSSPRRKFGRSPTKSLDHLFSSFSPDPKKKSKASDSLNEIATILNRRKVAVSKEGVRKNLLNFLDACEERLLLENESVFKAARAEEIIRQSEEKTQVVMDAMRATKELRKLCKNGTPLPEEVKGMLIENMQTTMTTALSEGEAANIVQIGADFTSEETTKDGFLTKLRSILSIPWIIHLMMLCYALYLYIIEEVSPLDVYAGRTPEPEQTWTQSLMTATGIGVSGSFAMILDVIKFMNRPVATEDMPLLENTPVADGHIVVGAPFAIQPHDAPLVGVNADYQDEAAHISPEYKLLAMGLMTVINVAMEPRLVGTVMNLFSPQPEPGIPEQLNTLLELLQPGDGDLAWENLVFCKIWPLLIVVHMLKAIFGRLRR